MHRVARAAAESGWFYLSRADFDEFYFPLLCVDGTLVYDGHEYRLIEAGDTEVVLRRIG